MKAKILPLLGIAFVVAIVSTGIFYGLIVGKLGSGSGAGSQRLIVVAARKLERGTVLKESDVKAAPWPGEAPKGAFDNLQQVAGLTVLETIQDQEPVTQLRLSARDSAGGAALAVPAGMRAVSIHVNDSSGVVAMLSAGQRVDVQVVRNRPNQGGEMELRTILQNVEVLSAAPQEGRAGGVPVVTLLVSPANADVLGLADSGARVRLALRNPLDKEKPSQATLGLATLFHYPPAPLPAPSLRAAASPSTGAPRTRPVAGKPLLPDTEGRQLLLRVRFAEVGPGALEEFGARLLLPRRSDHLQVSAFRPDWDLDAAVRLLQAKRQIEILSASNLLAGNHREVSVQAGASWTAARAEQSLSRPVPGAPPDTPRACGMRIQFLPSISALGTVRLRVEPEITSPQGEGVATRKIETEVELTDGQSFLVAGLGEAGEGASWDRLFPGHSIDINKKEVVVLVNLQLVKPARAGRQSAALLSKP